MLENFTAGQKTKKNSPLLTVKSPYRLRRPPEVQSIGVQQAESHIWPSRHPGLTKGHHRRKPHKNNFKRSMFTRTNGFQLYFHGQKAGWPEN